MVALSEEIRDEFPSAGSLCKVASDGVEVWP